MPRIRQYAQKYANEDFWREIQSRKALMGIRTDKALAEALGLSSQGFSRRKQNVDVLSLTDLRNLVKVLHPDPVLMLKLLGYTGKEIPGDLKTKLEGERV